MKSNQTKKIEPEIRSKFVKLHTNDLHMQILINGIPKRRSSNITHGDGFAEFLTHRIYELCKNKIIPALQAGTKSKKAEKCIRLKSVQIEGSELTNIELLEQFADLHKTSVAEIVYMYILFPMLEKEFLTKKLIS